MTSLAGNTTHSLTGMERTLFRLREQMRELGLGVGIYDVEGRCISQFHPASGLCWSKDGGCGLCPKEMHGLADRVIAERGSLTAQTSCGCCLIGTPILWRRRLLGAVIAAFPVGEMFEDAPSTRPPYVRHSRRQAGDFLHILEWVLERELELQVTKKEIANLSVNLTTTYEELSLVYRISGQMEVTQSPAEFFQNVCREVQEVMDIAAAVAVIYPHPSVDDEELVVIEGAVDLNAEQIRLLASARIAPLLSGSRPVVDNQFRADPGSGLEGGGVQNLIAAPLTNDRDLMGMLIGFNKSDTDFDSIDLKLINSIADQGSIFLANSRLYADLQELLMGVLHALTSSIDAKDPYTCGHSERVALVARRIALEAGLPAEQVRQIYLSGLLHDVGKIGIPESVLCKPGRLTESEYETIKRHPMIGSRILAGIRHLDNVIDGILMHHERPDGEGYPQGLRGRQIPIEGRILGLADTFDAMTSDRTYRKALPLAAVMDEIRRHAGLQFDVDLVDLFLGLDLEQLLAEVRRHGGGVLPPDLVEELKG